MARMIPSVISPEVKSTAERRVFEWFNNDPQTEDWIVLHSLGITNHNKTIYGEADFFVLAPNYGVFAIEVKGGRVKRDSGIWYFTDKYGNTNKKAVGPFDQARNSIFSIIKSLKTKLDNKHNHITKIFFGYGVMFPDIVYKATGIDEEQWQIFDSNDGRNVGSFIIRIALQTKSKWEKHYGSLNKERIPTIDDVEYIATVLRGDFDKAVPINVQFRYAENSLLELTKEQYRCIDQLDDNPRCLIQGPAGTGKTILAVEETKKAIANGKRVALFCFNSNLGDWLHSYFLSLESSFKPAYVGTFHKFMIKVVQEKGMYLDYPVEDNTAADFYSDYMPSLAQRALQKGIVKFDKIIIDEAQDLIQLPYLNVMDLSLKKGVVRGTWTMFGDFTMQAIYSNGKTRDELLKIIEDKTSFIRFKLTLNCRNTRPICEEIQTITGFTTPSKMWAKIEGPPVQYLTYFDNFNQKTCLEKLLSSLLENNIDKQNITILSPFKRDNSVVSLIKKYDIRDFSVRENNHITFCTIQGYKGLENSIVILTDIDTFQSYKLMYIALSRARSGLYILESDSAYREYLGLQKRRFIL